MACLARTASRAASCSRTGRFLGPDEIRNMRTVPELVFVNCCHLAQRRRRSAAEHRYDRAEFRVRRRGSADRDRRALRHRRRLGGGRRRGQRVRGDVLWVAASREPVHRRRRRGARSGAYERSPHVNTWAAYQCYGDPDWVFRRKAPDPNQVTAPLVEDFSGVGLGDVVEARARADRRPDEVSGRRCGGAARQPGTAREAVRTEVGRERRRRRAVRRGVRRGRRRRERACSGTNAPWPRRMAGRR